MVKCVEILLKKAKNQREKNWLKMWTFMSLNFSQSLQKEEYYIDCQIVKINTGDNSL